MRTSLIVVTCALLGLSAGLVGHFPASHAVALMAPSSVYAHGVEGTVWAGHAQRLDYGAPTPITALRWRLAPRHLLRGRIGFDTRFDIAGGRTTVQIRVTPRGAVSIRDATFRGTATGVMPLLDVPSDIRIEGNVLAQVDRARWVDGRPRGIQGRVLWDRAGMLRPLYASLGTVVTEIRPQPEGGHRLTLKNRNSPLAIEGEAEADADGRYDLQLRFHPGNETSREVTDLLSTFAQRENGAFVMRSRGLLPWH